MLQISRQKISGKNFFVDTLKKVKKERGGCIFLPRGYSGKYLSI
jgi:hypothetical protein